MRAYYTMMLFLREWLRDRSTVFWTFVFPILLLLIFGFIFGGSGGESFTLYVQDNDSPENMTDLSNIFVEALNKTEVIRVVPVPSGVDPVDYAVNNLTLYRFPRILVIPDGFSRNLTMMIMYGQAEVMYSFMERILQYVPPEALGNASGSIKMGMSYLELFLNSTMAPRVDLLFYSTPGDSGADVLKSFLLGFSQSFLMRAVNMSVGFDYSYRPLGEMSAREGVIGFYTVGVILMSVLTLGVFGLSSIISTAKSKGLISRLATTPLRKHEMVAGLILTETFIALLVTVIVLLVSYVFFGVLLVPGPAAIIVIVLGALCFSGLGALVGGLSKDPNTANTIANIVVFPMLFLSGVVIPDFLFPPALKAFSMIFPLHYFGTSLRASLVYHSLSNAYIDVVVVLVFTIVFFVAGIKSFKWGEE